MQLSRFYCNRPELFGPIDFNTGAEARRLNVVFARITKPKDKNRDSHNLGKTTLIHLLDFMLIGNVAEESHFLAKHKARFERFEFFLEIALTAGNFATIRRSPAEPSVISLKRHAESDQDLTALPDEQWDHPGMTFDQARRMLDSWLDLRVLAPWDYRKGITYFLRSQNDYQDILQIQKFMLGRDHDWKPFALHLVGMNHTAAERKYQIDQLIEDEEQRRVEKQAEVQIPETDLAKLNTQIEIRRSEITKLSGQLDRFSFAAEERRISRNLVEEVEQTISQLLNQLYNTDADIAQIESSLSRPIKFDPAEIKAIFNEAAVALPDSLMHSYEELVEFNKRLSSERNAALKKRLKDLKGERRGLQIKHEELDRQRSEYLEIIQNADTFRKYKALQRELSDQRAELIYLEMQIERLNAVAEITARIQELQRERAQRIAELQAELLRKNPTRSQIALTFNEFTMRLLDLEVDFYVTLNKLGNVEFKFDPRRPSHVGETSSLSEGKSYKQLLCALFDLALLKVYADRPFYHFVYHDGVLEGLDNRKKITFLELVREVIAGGRIQYMLSAIDTDLPRDDDDHKIPFSDDEIVLTLHDDGPSGRLFRMEEF